MELNNILSLAFAYYKDRVQRKIFEEFREESNRFLEADADARRKKAKENILAMAKLKIELRKFKKNYADVKTIAGSFPPIDEYIRQIEVEIKRLSYIKNRRR